MRARSGDEKFRFARLLGFDFLRDRSGRWWLVEVNDVPANLQGADRLATGAFGAPRILERIAAELSGGSDGGAVVLLRPSETFDGLPRGANVDEDCQELQRLVQRLGRNCFVVAPSELDAADGLKLRDGTSIATVFRRTRLRPDCAPSFCTINPALTSYICRDKLLAPSALHYSMVASVPTVLAESRSLLSASESGLWILKPRFGSGSKNIRRICDRDIVRGEHSVGHVLQPWLEPSTVAIGPQNYYFDVRIISFDGEIVGGYARCAAAPAGGIAKGLPIEWLTTTGQRLPIRLGQTRNSDAAVYIDDSDKVLLSNAVLEFTRNIETAVHSFLPLGATTSVETNARLQEGNSAVLYVGGASELQSLTAMNAAVAITSEYLPKVGVCDIDAVDGDWNGLVESSGWELMPQLLAGGEHFLGSGVIAESIRSGEVSRALSGSIGEVAKCRDATACVKLLPGCEHEAEVWGVAASADGSIRASCSADGSICISTSKTVRRYRIGQRWINAISLSPCGQLLAFGTSEPAGYFAPLVEGAITNLSKVTGDTRWVNGVLALSNKILITCASNGRLALWETGGKLLTTFNRKSRGQVLGLLPSRRAGNFYAWSSDGVVSVHSDSDLTCVMEWSAPTNRYVTVATELPLNGKLEYFAMDVRGKLYSSFASESILDVKQRVWALCPGAQDRGLRLLTIHGDLAHVEFIAGVQNYVTRKFSTSSPTVCRALSNGEMLIGLANGKVMTCQ